MIVLLFYTQLELNSYLLIINRDSRSLLATDDLCIFPLENETVKKNILLMRTSFCADLFVVVVSLNVLKKNLLLCSYREKNAMFWSHI